MRKLMKINTNLMKINWVILIFQKIDLKILSFISVNFV